MADQIVGHRENIKLVVGGPVQAGGGTYIERPTDKELFQACLAGEFTYILASRQIGKSSLIFETVNKLKQVKVTTANVDLTKIGRTENEKEWYFSLIERIAIELNLRIDIEKWWDERPPLSASIPRFLQFLQEVVLVEITEPIVIFIDEIDVTLGLEFTDDFFAAIRSIHSERARNPVYKRLTFVLIGVATPDELITDDTRTPFNIGQAIILPDFTEDECEPLRSAIKTKYQGRGEDYFQQIYRWTNGHPYLTLKSCQAVLKWKGKDDSELVDKLVEREFLSSAGRLDHNLQFVQNAIRGDRYVQEMLRIYKQILQGEKPVKDTRKSPPINKLKLYGLVMTRHDRLMVRNKLYTKAFDSSWVDEMLRKTRPEVPEVFQDYTILAEIGQGGFATVYLAQTFEANKTQPMALKVLNLEQPELKRKSGADQVKWIKRFEHEADTLKKLNHPNIIRVVETGIGDEKALFIAMEYISGGSLRERLKVGPVPRNEAIYIVKCIGEALSYAHKQGVIHLDVNPGNILLDKNKEPIRPVLTDFGLAHLLSVDDPRTRIITDSVIGTPNYIAPEQWKQENLGPLTDLYALAITFFEMLTGRPPFEVGSPFELMNKQINEPLPPVSSLVSDLEAFDDILFKATAKNPSDRYQSVADFIETLEMVNNRVEQAERMAQQDDANRIVDAVQSYIKKSNYDWERALGMIEVALEIYPQHSEALRLKGEIWLKRSRFEEALEAYKRAYEEERNPNSKVGKDYFSALGQVASIAWQRGDDQAALAQYKVIKQILDEGYRIGTPMDIWKESWSELVKDHQEQGERVYTTVVTSKNLETSINILKRQIDALETLGADSQSQNLKDKLRDLQIKQIYSEGQRVYATGNPESLVEATQVLQRQIEALEKLEAYQESRDLQGKLRALQITSHCRLAEQVYAGGNPSDITEAIQILERELEALDKLEADDEAQDLKNKLRALNIKQHYRVGKVAYAQGSPTNIIEAIETLKNKIEALEKLEAVTQIRDLENKLWQLQVKRHYDRGQKAYNKGKHENSDEIIQILEQEIKSLDELEAIEQSQDLRDKQRQLRIVKWEKVVKAEADTIYKINTQANDIHFNNEILFQHYTKIDEAYQNLIRLEPDNEQWRQERPQKLRERAVYRLNLAQRAEAEADYEMALGHYRWIMELDQKFNELTQGLDIEQRSKGLIQELGLNDLAQKILYLEEVVNYDRKYREIQSLIGQKKFLKALEYLNEDFIRQGYYEYRDTAKLLWGAVYANQHEGQTPPEWEANASLKKLEWKYASFTRAFKVLTPLAFLGAIILGIIIGYYFQSLPEPTRIWGLVGFGLVTIYFFWYIWFHYGSKIRL